MSKNPINFQDWEPVVLNKKKEVEKKEFVQKPAGNKNLIVFWMKISLN